MLVYWAEWYTILQANYDLWGEIKQINQQLILTVVDISDEEVDSHAASAFTKVGEGTIVKCSFTGVGISPNLRSETASLNMVWCLYEICRTYLVYWSRYLISLSDCCAVTDSAFVVASAYELSKLLSHTFGQASSWCRVRIYLAFSLAFVTLTSNCGLKKENLKARVLISLSCLCSWFFLIWLSSDCPWKISAFFVFKIYQI